MFNQKSQKRLLLSVVLIFFIFALTSCKNDIIPAIELQTESYEPDVVYGVSDFSQADNYIYIADKTQILRYDMTSGEEKVFADGFGSIVLIHANNDNIYVFDADAKDIIVLDGNGGETKRINITDSPDGANWQNIISTQKYIVLSVREDLKSFLYIVNKSDNSIKEQVIPGISLFKEILFKDGDIIFIHYEGGRDSGDNYFAEYNIDENMIYQKYYLNLNSTTGKSCYIPDKKQIISATLNSLYQNIEVFTFGLENETISSIYKASSAESNIVSITSGRNIISWYDEKAESFYFYDINKKRDTITILIEYAVYNLSLEYYINEFEKQNNLTVNTVIYNDRDKLNLKLLANEKDFDLYLTSPWTVINYVKSGAFEDLYLYDSIKNSIAGKEALFEKTAFYGNKMFGVPYETAVFGNDMFSPLGAVTSSMAWYLTHNVNLLSSEYTDKNGAALTQVYENMKSNLNDLSHISGYELLSSNYILMNPFSQNKEKAADFLSGYIRLLSGQTDISGDFDYIREQIIYYPDNRNFDNMLMYYNICHIDMQDLFKDGYENAASGKMTAFETAKEVSKKIDMITNE